MRTERWPLEYGTHLVLDKEYEIKDVIGAGASCIVYLAENTANNRKVLIKELFPCELGIFRDQSNALVVPLSSQQSFSECKEKLKKAVKLQISFHNTEDVGNSTSDAEEIVERNNTLYVIMGKVVGETFDKYIPQNLTAVLKTASSLTKAVAMYHNKGYLHLDIKAENVFVIKETNELVKLFDFDSVHTKREIQSGKCLISSTWSCASPELRECMSSHNPDCLKNIDERTDLSSIGALIFKKIMGREVEVEDRRPKRNWDYNQVDLLKTASPQTKAALTEILRHTLARRSENRYQSAGELVDALEKAAKLSENDGEKRKEFQSSLLRLYDVTINYRDAIRNADVKLINKTTSELTSEIQKIYNFCERYRYTDTELSSNASEIVKWYNMYAELYTHFVASTDKTSKEAQAFAREAEQKFTKMVDLIVNLLW